MPTTAREECFAYLIRHGATANNQAVPPRLQGRADVGLSEEGVAQARRTAAALAARPIAAVYSSPLRRARETALALAGEHALEVLDRDALIEVDVGAWEERSWAEIQATEPEAYRRHMGDPERFGYRDGENLAQVRDRALPAIQSVMQQHAGQEIAIVAHNVVNRTVLSTLLNVPLVDCRRVHQNNCGINLLRLRQGELKVLMVNGVLHL